MNTSTGCFLIRSQASMSDRSSSGGSLLDVADLAFTLAGARRFSGLNRKGPEMIQV